MTITAFIVGCLERLDFRVGALITVIVTTMAVIKRVAALKFYLAVSLVMLAKLQVLRGDGALPGRP